MIQREEVSRIEETMEVNIRQEGLKVAVIP